MKHLIKNTLIILLLMSYQPQAEARRPVELNIGRGEALVNHLEGAAHRFRGSDGAYLPLKIKDILQSGDEIEVGAKNSRVEILLPDKSIARFAQNSRFRLVEIQAQDNRLNTTINLAVGQAYANLSRTAGKPNFKITTENAVAGVRGTVYRMNLEENKSLLVRVYEGEVRVSPAPKSLEPPKPVGPPEIIAGPKPVAGPTAVTMEEWIYIIGAMQQIRIGADGVPGKPTSFTEAEDIDEWVKWNKRRDKLSR